MNCRDLSSFLAEYVADELPGEVLIEFESHVNGCGDCHAYLAQYRTTVRAASAVGEEPRHEPLPEALVAAILAAVEKRQT